MVVDPGALLRLGRGVVRGEHCVGDEGVRYPEVLQSVLQTISLQSYNWLLTRKELRMKQE